MLANVYDLKTNISPLNVLEYSELLFEMPKSIIGGGWTSEKDGPIIRQAGTLYSSPVLVSPDPLSTNAKITTVTWNWCVTAYQDNLKVYLCDMNQTPGCLEISSWSEGETDIFNDRCANHQFKFYFYVPREEKSSSTVCVKNNTLSVNWKVIRWRDSIRV